MTALRANLLLVALGLSLLGLVMVYSATYREFGAEYLFLRAGHLVMGIAVFLLVRRFRYTAWRGIAPALYVLVLVSLALVLVPGIGTKVGGARRWFDLGVITLQPAEFAKIAAVVALSCAVARIRPGSGLPFRPLLGVGLLFGLVFLEPDFGTAVVLLAGAGGVLWASEIRTRDLLLASGAGVAALIALMVVEPYRRERFTTFLDPWAVSEGPGYQIVQSLVAINDGSVLGTGAGAGADGVYIPEVQTDMIFALVGEELGLFGMVVVIAAFSYMALAGFCISLMAPTVFARCMAAGLTSLLAVQATFNIGAAMNVLPLAGMTLPFVSYGGSSLLTSFAMVGILYRISEDSERAREVRPRRFPARPAVPDRRRRYRRARDPRVVRGG